MNHTVVLDTNALIRLFKGESEEVKRAVMGAARIVIPLAVCAEFKAGVEGDSSGPPYDVLVVLREVARGRAVPRFSLRTEHVRTPSYGTDSGILCEDFLLFEEGRHADSDE